MGSGTLGNPGLSGSFGQRQDMQSRAEVGESQWRGSVQNVRLEGDQVIIGQVGDISRWVITVLQL